MTTSTKTQPTARVLADGVVMLDGQRTHLAGCTQTAECARAAVCVRSNSALTTRGAMVPIGGRVSECRVFIAAAA